MVEVVLGGINVDREALEQLRKSNNPEKYLGPESISAGYARVSRADKSVTELRRDAGEDVAAARKSNNTIVFEMGHHSVAEHAVFNFDILGISRIAIEKLEIHRLNSYTEKSQRYVKMGGDFMTPKEFSKRLGEKHAELINIQNKFYFKALPILVKYQREKNSELAKIADEKQKKGVPDKSNAEKNILEGLAKEDARYVLSLSTTGQLGMTINARNLEYLIMRSATSKKAEVRELGEKLCAIGHEIAPSLIIFTEPNKYWKNSKDRLKKFVMSLPEISKPQSNFLESTPMTIDDVTLLDYDRDADNKLVAALIQSSNGEPFAQSYNRARNLTEEKKTLILKSMLEDIEQWDAMSREFEIINLMFELKVSSSNFAQLKRHRMMTLLPQDYDTSLGYTTPESIFEAHLKPEFDHVMEKTLEFYNKVKKQCPDVAEYALTNAHKRRVVMSMNARELYHFARMRDDNHAQWDIRNNTASNVVALAEKVMPLTMILACGKDKFHNLYEKVYSK